MTGTSGGSLQGAVLLSQERTIMKKLISAAALAIGISTGAFAQTAGPTQVFIASPTGTTVANFYKQNVYDQADNKIGDVDDLLVDQKGQITAVLVGVGGFLSMGEKDVAIPFSALHASEKNNKWYLVLNTTKDALKAAPGFKYDKTKTAWVPAAN